MLKTKLKNKILKNTNDANRISNPKKRNQINKAKK